jgi:hypothetical protein
MGDTCATCRHWTDITSQYDDSIYHPRYDSGKKEVDPAGYRNTVREPMPGRWGWCAKVDELDPQTKDCQFYVTDGSDYTATLHTRETFGCNQWEGQADG